MEGAKNEGQKKAAASDPVKKDDGKVLLKIDMNSEDCAKKIIRTVESMGGVKDVMAAANKLTMTGNVDPAKIKRRFDEKFKKVEIISPQPIKDSAGDGADGETKPRKVVKETKPRKEVIAFVRNCILQDFFHNT